jgi:hypothetical protein
MLRGLFPARPWRLLRQGIRALDRIAEALEQQNRVQQQLMGLPAEDGSPEQDSAISYVNPEEFFAAETLRAKHFAQTGVTLSDEDLLDYMRAEDALAGRDAH